MNDILRTVLVAILVGLMGFVASKVWEGVELAKENKTHREMMAEELRELRSDVKGLRSDLDQLWGATNDLARGE